MTQTSERAERRLLIPRHECLAAFLRCLEAEFHQGKSHALSLLHKTLLSLSSLTSTLHSSPGSPRHAVPHTCCAPAEPIPHNPIPASALASGLYSKVTFSSPPCYPRFPSRALFSLLCTCHYSTTSRKLCRTATLVSRLPLHSPAPRTVPAVKI